MPSEAQTVRVGTSTLVGAGRGLFAAAGIPRGAVIARFETPRVVDGAVKVAGEEERLHRDGIPHDAAIYASDELMLVDDAIQAGETARPWWYMMNHASKKKANAVNRWVHVNGQIVNIEWRARRDIAAGEELLYDYGEPDSRWKD